MKTRAIILAVIFAVSFLFDTAAQNWDGKSSLFQRQMEYLDRGLVAVHTDPGVFLSWRLLGTDDRNVKFNVYRNGVKLNSSPLTGATNLQDAQGTVSNVYSIGVVDPVSGEETSRTETVEVWSNIYKTLQMVRPEASMPDVVYTPNDISVGDLTGNGQYDIIVKWNPSNARDNAQAGITDKVYIDAYTLDGKKLWRIDLGVNIRAGAHYTQFMVYDLDGDGRAELVCKTAPGTIDGQGKFVLMGSDDPNVDYRNSNGFIVSGPEYLTVFDGLTGAERHTIPYNPPRGGDGSGWGDNRGNRVDRFLACIAYLDGVKPSVIMGRGYYTRSTLAAYDFVNGKLVERWFHDSNTAGEGAWGQGNHNISVADVDGDGYDEIIFGSCVIDHDGTMKSRTGLGHGDALHVSDMDPDRPGYEVWQVTESRNRWNHALYDPNTGALIWHSENDNTDNGRGLAADIDPTHRGFEMWSSTEAGIYNVKGEKIADTKPTVNFRIYWDGDLQDEILDRTNIDKWDWVNKKSDRMMSFADYGAASINGTKANPCISADLFGDWREEVIYYNSADPSQLLIFTTTIPTEHRLYTLMHDPVYRLAIAWQNVVYNQPPHLGFYIGCGLENIPYPFIFTPKAE